MATVSSEFLINTTVAGIQADASVTVLKDGRFVVVWRDASASTSSGFPYDDIRYQIFHADGSKDGAERIANSEREEGLESATYYQFQPSVSALADGGFAITFRDNRSTTSVPFAISNELVAQRFDADGTKVGSAATIMPAYEANGSGFTVSPAEPSVLGLSNGNYVVVNHTNNFPNALAPEDDSGIVMQIFNSAGVQILGWTAVNATTASLQIDAQLTELSNGNFVVVWNSNTHLPFGWEVKAQEFTAAGVRVGSEITFPSVESVSQFNRPQVAALDNGRYVVTWVMQPSTDEFNSGLRTDIVARIVDANGNFEGGDIAVHVRDGLGQGNPVVAATADGTFLIVWQEGSETSGLPIRAQLFNSDGTASGGLLTLGSSSAPDDTDPRITVTKDGRFFVVWEDDTRNLGGEPNDGIHGAFVDPRTVAARFVGGTADDSFMGTIFADFINGSGGDDFLAGGDGDDNLAGGAGADTLKGGNGNDLIEGGGAADTLDGGAGAKDMLNYGPSAAISVDLQSGIVSGGHADGDLITGFEGVIGTAFADTISGDNRNNVLKGGGGGDTLNGRAGDDMILGGDGDDVITGGRGRDRLTGGANADRFVYAALNESTVGLGADLIKDFESGVDKIDLSAMDAIAGPGNNSFTFIFAGGFGAVAGQLRYQDNGATTSVFGDTTGDGVADFEIVFTGSIAFQVSDFEL